MRRRLVLSMVAVTVLGVLVLGVPLAVFAGRVVRNDAARRSDRQADAVGFAIDDAIEAGQPVDQRTLNRFADGKRFIEVIEVVNGHTRRTVAGSRLRGPTRVSVIHVAHGGTVRLTLPADDVNRRALRASLLVAVLGVVGIAVSTGLAWVVAQRLNRPLRDLAAVSRRLGDGDLTARASVHGIAETDAVAHALNQGAGRVEALVRAEREFSANASHQLRGPLTAISLRLEELVEHDEPDVRASAGAALEQVDRLQAIITDLLALAAGGRAEPVAVVDVADLARQRVQAWRHPYAEAGRPLVDPSAGPCMAHASAAGVGQAIDALLDNALHHGGGEVSVTVRPTGRHVAIAVADQGSGVPPGQEQAIFDRHVSMAGGTGVGLALARTLIEADNGRIDLVQPRPAVFQILLAGGDDGDGATSNQVT